MALIVGDDFQHILRVLNTNVDGREKVRRREFVFIVRVACVCARKGMRLKFSSPALHFLALVSSLVRDPKRAFVFEWTTLGETNSRVKSFAPCSESISARECVLFERVVRSRGVLRRRDGNEISSTFRAPPNTKSEKGSRETNFPLRFPAWFSIEFSFSLFILSLFHLVYAVYYY